MKRYKYSKWFKKIMDKIPFGIIRVLVLVLIIIGTLIRDAFRGLIAAIVDDIDSVEFKAMIKDVWNWREWGDKE